MDQQPVYLKPKEVAEMFKVHYTTVLYWIKVGRVEAINLSATKRPIWRIDRHQFKTQAEIEKERAKEREEILAQLNLRQPERRHIQ